MASGRKRLWNLAAATHPTYGETFLDRTDRSDSSSGTASTQEHVPESQSQGRSSAHEHVSPAQYELPPYYPQYEADYQPQYEADFLPQDFGTWQLTHPTYGETFLDRTDRSDSSFGTASTQEHVPESQSQGRSSAHEHVPPAQYELPPYYPQYEADYQPHCQPSHFRAPGRQPGQQNPP
ncbi:hypothetical protein F2Q69_00024690 [Brassica cretica]|uniref:Uncharacterized protein n=1 Tax=Brassica cretica TaxID=69181 RepID=A0A8S9QIW5_BRACR|nr:hypothetical protein F2Q69_00024690 [Brassica cretica]